ncbi:MAG: InlB B-repeat-containing protein [Bacteroidaceae bacterium]|nr:InlB B-repeat-containing protein [Bacteroidaceae bacterium]
MRISGITVTLEDTKYTVSLAGSPAGTVTGGTISASPTSAAAGTTVSLTATPGAGYVFESWTVTDADDDPVTVTNNQFTMPAKNVTVDATFNVDNTDYDVVVTDETGGTITASKTKAKSGEVVTLTAALDAGYAFDSWIVEDVNGDPVATTPVTDTKCTFVMPSGGVWVSAVYKAIHTVSYSVCGIAQTPVQRLDGEPLNLPTPASVNGKDFAGWSTTNNVASPSFVENTAAVTSDLTLYAIFGPKIVYKLVEADQADWRGQYLIAYNSTTFADGRTGGTEGMGAQNVKANPGEKLTGKEVDGAWGDTYCVTIEAVNDSKLSSGYLLKTQDGKYNYQTSNSNGLPASTNRATALTYPLSITFNSSSDIDIAISAGAVFHYNNNGGYFRFYNNGGQENVYLYKRTEIGGTEYTLANEVEVPVSAVMYATLYSDVPLTVPTGVEAYTIVVEGDVAKVKDTYAAGDAIAANTAVVIAADADDYTFSVAASGTAPSDNNLMGTVTEETIAADWTNYKYYKLANDATDGIGFYLFNDTNDNFTNGAGKAYLRTSASATVRGFSFADIVSAIERTKAESQHGGAIYDLQGRRVEKPGKGLYIVGGKKVLF